MLTQSEIGASGRANLPDRARQVFHNLPKCVTSEVDQGKEPIEQSIDRKERDLTTVITLSDKSNIT